jgi:uncharacterized membrane protein (DUF4010 family)
MDLTTETLTEVAYALGVGVLIGLERSFGASLTASPPDDEADEAGLDDAAAEAPVGDDASADAAEPTAPATLVVDAAPPTPDAETRGEREEVLGAEYIGVRTFAVLSLMGYGAAVAGDQIASLPAALLVGVSVLVVGMYFRATHQGLGITTEIAAIGVCALGMLCHSHPQAAAVIALLVTVFLASKRFTHRTVARMRRIELTDTLKFLVVILIVLPLLPNRTLDPYEAFNPYKVGLLVVLISGIGYVGYFLTRLLGAKRGLAITGVIGGLTSSTAVTAAMAQKAKEEPDWRLACVVATLAANATMFARVLVVVAVLDIELMKRLAWSVGGMALTTAVATGVLWFTSSRSASSTGAGPSKVKLENPFSLGPAIKFAAFFVFILFVLKLARTYLGDQGLWIAAALSGLADVDAITLSLSEQAHNAEITRRVAAIAITIAVVSNSVTKTGISISAGGWRFGRVIAAVLGAATVVGLVAALLV